MASNVGGLPIQPENSSTYRKYGGDWWQGVNIHLCKKMLFYVVRIKLGVMHDYYELTYLVILCSSVCSFSSTFVFTHVTA